MEFFEQSDVFLCNEDLDGYGYICSEHNGRIFTYFWAKDMPGKKISYASHVAMHIAARRFELSMLTTLSPSHIALSRMFKAYLAWLGLN